MTDASATSDFASRFGGMWIDRPDFRETLRKKVRRGRIPQSLEKPIEDFERDGVVILRGAAAEEDLDRFESSISNAFRNGNERLIAQGAGDNRPLPVVAGMPRRMCRVVDSFAVLPEALNLLSSPRLVEFMTAVLNERPLLFQSLSFDMGSEQRIHQDTAYVVVDRPMEMLACWIALEDVKEGSGELRYITGSHRLPDFNFGGKKHWDIHIDSQETHEEWQQWLITESARRDMKTEKFLGKRGDILVWHADIAHGGSPITDPELTRKSLVGHYCPVSAEPFYMKHIPTRMAKLRHRGIGYCSSYYDLIDMPEHRRNYYATPGITGIAQNVRKALGV